MRARSINRNSGDDREPSVLVARTFWVSDVPRLIPLCRLFGHKPVVDGTQGIGTSPPGRWVACDRCGQRADPQGTLDPGQWDIGQPYPGPFNTAWPLSPTVRKQMHRKGILPKTAGQPGPIPAQPVGTVGGEIHIGKSKWRTTGISVKLGNCASEQILSASLRLGPVGSLYLHTEDHGRWLQRRLNPTGYESRVTEISLRGSRIEWKIWSPRNHQTKQPKWRSGSLKMDPRDRIFGRRHYDYQNVGDKQDAIVRMPHGDDHTVQLQLQRCTYGRNKRSFHSWTVDWECREGIPTKPGGSGVQGSAVEVSAQAVKAGSWQVQAVAAIALKITGSRARYDYPVPKAG